jgi:hypothetical protein
MESIEEDYDRRMSWQMRRSSMGPTLIAESDTDRRAQYEAAGLRANRQKSEPGRMSATFYITDQAGSTVDTATTDAGYSRRSCTDALLRRHLGIDGPGRQLFPLDRTGGL